MTNGNLSPRLDLLETELARQLDTKTSLEQRGITVITASGALVTLLFGFSAAITKSLSFNNFNPWEKMFLAIALGLFISSSVLGVSANIPRPMGQLRTANATPDVDPTRYYDAAVWDALRTGTHPEVIADELSDAISVTKNSNRRRAQAIRIATSLQAGAIVALGIAIVLIIFHPGTAQVVHHTQK